MYDESNLSSMKNRKTKERERHASTKTKLMHHLKQKTNIGFRIMWKPDQKNRDGGSLESS